MVSPMLLHPLMVVTTPHFIHCPAPAACGGARPSSAAAIAANPRGATAAAGGSVHLIVAAAANAMPRRPLHFCLATTVADTVIASTTVAPVAALGRPGPTAWL